MDIVGYRTRRTIGRIFFAIAAIVAVGGILAACAPPTAKSVTTQVAAQPPPTSTVAQPLSTPTRVVPTPTAVQPSPTSIRVAPTATVVQPSPTAAKASPTPIVVTRQSDGPAVYFFFSTSCEYCSAQAPDMQAFYRDTGARVIGVPLHVGQAQAELFAKRYGLTFEIREDASLVAALGPVTRHPVIAFQSAPGATLVRASDGTISVRALEEKYQGFTKGGTSARVEVNRGRG